MAKNDGGPAFPVGSSPKYGDRNGMSLRDWFAGQIAATHLSSIEMAEVIRSTAKSCRMEPDAFLALRSYQIADALLAESVKDSAS